MSDDAADRLTTLTTPLGTTTYTYDSANQLTDRTDADGRRVTFAYDSGGRRTAERWLDASGGTVRTVTNTYDSNGRLTGVTDPDATLTFTYDSGGNQLTAETSGAGGQPDVKLTSTYDSLNSRTGVTDNLATPVAVSYAYDNAERLTTITWTGGNVAYGYDGANRVTSEKRTSGLSPVLTTLAYDAAGRLTTLTHGSAFFGGIATYVYGYDAADRVTSEQNAEGTVRYSYDDTSQLTGASGSRAETYTYDSGGNRTMTGYSTGSGNELTASPGYTYTYDAEGNMTGKTQASNGNNWTYAYDYRNRLTGATERSSGGTVISQSTYTYDPMNRRIETNVNGTVSFNVYDGLNPWADFTSGGGGATLKTHYLYGQAVDDILARLDSGGGVAWYLKDRLGTVRDIVNNSSPSPLDHVVYDSYGNVTSETNSANGDRFKFAGMQYDSATGLYFDNARYYDPSGGRFVSQDPKGFVAGDPNLYRYVRNFPTNMVDPSGMDGIPIFELLVQGAPPQPEQAPPGVQELLDAPIDQIPLNPAPFNGPVLPPDPAVMQGIPKELRDLYARLGKLQQRLLSAEQEAEIYVQGDEFDTQLEGMLKGELKNPMISESGKQDIQKQLDFLDEAIKVRQPLINDANNEIAQIQKEIQEVESQINDAINKYGVGLA